MAGSAALALTLALAAWPFAVLAASPSADPSPWAWLFAVPPILLALTAAGLAITGAVLVWRAFSPPPAQAPTPAQEQGFSLHWAVGGFGAPARGWRLSTPLTQLLTGLALVGLSVALALARMPMDDGAKAVAAKEAKPAEAAAEPAAASKPAAAASPAASH